MLMFPTANLTKDPEKTKDNGSKSSIIAGSIVAVIIIAWSYLYYRCLKPYWQRMQLRPNLEDAIELQDLNLHGRNEASSASNVDQQPPSPPPAAPAVTPKQKLGPSLSGSSSDTVCPVSNEPLPNPASKRLLSPTIRLPRGRPVGDVVSLSDLPGGHHSRKQYPLSSTTSYDVSQGSSGYGTHTTSDIAITSPNTSSPHRQDKRVDHMQEESTQAEDSDYGDDDVFDP